MSAAAAVWPLNSKSAEHWWKNRWQAKSSKVHPTVFGHKFVAQLLGHMVREELGHLKDQRSQVWDDQHGWTHNSTETLIPLYVAAKDMAAFIETQTFLHVDFTTQAAMKTAGLSLGSGNLWSWYSDVPGKPGLITASPHATLALRFPTGSAEKERNVHVVLSVLKAYDNMGAFNLEVVELQQDDSTQGRTVAEVDVDCLWSEPFSVADDTYVRFKTKKQMHYVLQLRATSPLPKRAKHKIKLLALTISAPFQG